jgi:hypothetical protein
VRIRRVLPGLCQPIVNGQVGCGYPMSARLNGRA